MRMKTYWLITFLGAALLTVACQARADEMLPPPRAVHAEGVTQPGPSHAHLRSGETVTLRVRQVIPCDGLSQGERMLNSLPPVQPGDQFLAELVESPGKPRALVGGSVTAVTPPGRFGRPGRVILELSQVLPTTDMELKPIPWQFNVEDQRFSTAQRRMLTALFMLEGIGVGAGIGAQVDAGRSGAVGIGSAAGLLLGIAYASLQPGREAGLEPGDTFRVIVGEVSVKSLPHETPMILYPAQDPARRKGKQ